MPTPYARERFRGLIKAIADMFRASEEVAKTIEDTAIKPVVEPLDSALKELILREYIYRLQPPPQPTLEQMEAELVKTLCGEKTVNLYDCLNKVVAGKGTPRDNERSSEGGA
ncbi:MAG: hypothetical protein F7C35_09090 [Desulfurococcales archaeon]|nr:hypothetical protein [Desulfurococcales archaeon]